MVVVRECTGLGVKDGLRDVDKLYNYRLHQGRTDFFFFYGWIRANLWDEHRHNSKPDGELLIWKHKLQPKLLWALAALAPSTTIAHQLSSNTRERGI